VARRKERLYDEVPIDFVAVSSWLRRKSEESTLLHGRSVTVIPNAFQLPPRESLKRVASDGAVRLIFGAARLDDTVKGFPILIEAMKALKSTYPELASRTRLLLYGAIRDASLIERIPIEVEYVGVQHGMENISRLYLRSDIVLSTSHFETLPGTLVEGQAYGCVPVSFARGGQPDIIDDGTTGYLAEWSDDQSQAGANIAASIAQAVGLIELEGEAMRERMYESVSRKFSAAAVAGAYIALLQRPR
jgi:glycosyltransferase involved in cell wall biosynthesis